MESMRNQPKVLAGFLRLATTDLRNVARRVDDGAAKLRENSYETILAVAEALEESAATDPAGEKSRG